MCSLKKNVDSSICAAFKDLTSIIPTTPIVVALAIARVIAHPKPLINLRRSAFISRTIRVRLGHVGETNARPLNRRVRVCEATCYPVSPQDCRTSPRNARQADCERRQAKMINKNRLICYTACAVQSLPGMLP